MKQLNANNKKIPNNVVFTACQKYQAAPNPELSSKYRSIIELFLLYKADFEKPNSQNQIPKNMYGITQIIENFQTRPTRAASALIHEKRKNVILMAQLALLLHDESNFK